jgi:LuxR family transcriptional regulator, positive regulator of biofilm formation
MPHKNDDASFPLIYIVGSNLLQNKLLALCLEKELTVECNCLVALTMKDLVATTPEKMCIYLLDCFKRETAALEKCLETGSRKRMDAACPALFNVDPILPVEKLVRKYKVRGIFYQHDDRRVFLKGMRTILKGGMWLSRGLLSKCVLRSDRAYEADAHVVTPLSGREKEVLSLITLGLSNAEIADKLNLSPHTIKTHLYHIYKKIGAHNRLQATLWAAAYLC